jgi:hypothetical protein
MTRNLRDILAEIQELDAARDEARRALALASDRAAAADVDDVDGVSQARTDKALWQEALELLPVQLRGLAQELRTQVLADDEERTTQAAAQSIETRAKIAALQAQADELLAQVGPLQQAADSYAGVMAASERLHALVESTSLDDLIPTLTASGFLPAQSTNEGKPII